MRSRNRPKAESAKRGAARSYTRSGTEPKLPYTTAPGALRKSLAQVHSKPKPPKVNNALLSAWSLGGGNANSIIRVLKALGLLNSSSEPTEHYEAFMHRGTGPARLAARVREVYKPLFDAYHQPYKENDETLRNLFNINSGGAEGTITFQIQTFKAICEHADFTSGDVDGGSRGRVDDGGGKSDAGKERRSDDAGRPVIHNDLHIHLPENKSARDYEAIFEDIARHIYGRKPGEAE